MGVSFSGEDVHGGLFGLIVANYAVVMVYLVLWMQVQMGLISMQFITIVLLGMLIVEVTQVMIVTIVHISCRQVLSITFRIIMVINWLVLLLFFVVSASMVIGHLFVIGSCCLLGNEVLKVMVVLSLDMMIVSVECLPEVMLVMCMVGMLVLVIVAMVLVYGMHNHRFIVVLWVGEGAC